MGWDLEAEKAKTKKIEKEARESQEAYLSYRPTGRSSPGAPLGIIKGTSDTEKMPKDTFDREFITAIDATFMDLRSFGLVFDKFAKSGTSSDRFRGIGKQGVFDHLRGTLKKFRPEASEFFENQLKEYMGGK